MTQRLVPHKSWNLFLIFCNFTFPLASVHSEALAGLKVPNKISEDEFLVVQSRSKTVLKMRFLMSMLAPKQKVLDWLGVAKNM